MTRPVQDRRVASRRALRVLAVLVCLGAVACSTTYTEADVESAEYDAQGKARLEEKKDRELGAMGGRNAEAMGEAGEQVIIESDR